MSRIMSNIISADEMAGIDNRPPPPYEDHIDPDLAMAMPELCRCHYAEQRAVRIRQPIAEAHRDSLELYRDTSLGFRRRSRGFSERIVDLGRKARDSIVEFLSRQESASRAESIDGIDIMDLDGSTHIASPCLEDETAVYSSGDELELIEEEEASHIEYASPDAIDLDPYLTVLFERLTDAVVVAMEGWEFDDTVRDARFQAVYCTAEEEQWDASYGLVARIARRRQISKECFETNRVRLNDEEEDEIDPADLPFSIGMSI